MESVRQRKEEGLFQGQREKQKGLQVSQEKEDISEAAQARSDARPTLRGPWAKVRCYLLHLRRSLPNDIGMGYRQQLICFVGLATTEAKLASTRDVFPLPLSLSVEDEAFVSLAAQPGALERVPVKQ